jgi:hypothetical protein
MRVTGDIDVRPQAGEAGYSSLCSPAGVVGFLLLEADGGVDVESRGLCSAVFNGLFECAVITQVERPGYFVLARPYNQPSRRLGTVDALDELPDDERAACWRRSIEQFHPAESKGVSQVLRWRLFRRRPNVARSNG